MLKNTAGTPSASHFFIIFSMLSLSGAHMATTSVFLLRATSNLELAVDTSFAASCISRVIPPSFSASFCMIMRNPLWNWSSKALQITVAFISAWVSPCWAVLSVFPAASLPEGAAALVSPCPPEQAVNVPIITAAVNPHTILFMLFFISLLLLFDILIHQCKFSHFPLNELSGASL